MDKRILNILPEDNLDGYDQLTHNVTYIFEVPDTDYHVTYELDDFVTDMDIEVIYKSKLRECYKDNYRVHIASGCNSTGTPRGLVVNLDKDNALKLEKELIIFALLKDTKWTVTRIDNLQNKLDTIVRQEKFINSLFTFE